ncbi:MAG: M20/M25/M40 family metallo-hydrolase [Bacteroidota bacterium]
MIRITRILLLTGLILGSKVLLAQYSTEICTTDLQKQIGFLASDSLKGRKPGTPEDAVAAAYIRDCFSRAGLTLMFDKGYQKFEIVADVKAGENNSISFDGFSAKPNVDFTPLSFSSSASVTAPVVFAGYGFDLDLDSLKWSDYKGIDVKGKWAVILRSDPEPDKANSAFLPYEQERVKVLTAKDKGALGVMLVCPSDLEKTDVIMHMQYDKSPSDAGIPVFSISRAIADKLLASMNYTIASLEAEIKDNHKPVSLYLEPTVTATADVVKTRVTAQNVVGLLEGNDPVLKNEYIIIGGHFDHLGMGGEGSGSRTPELNAVHNGADDNASGTTGVIELAQKLSANHSKLKRSIVFVTFTGEEMGLLGSKEFVSKPPVDLKKVDAMINMDMIGRLNPETNTISVGGTGTSLESDSLLKTLETNRPYKITHSTDGYGPSDHASFYSENIPVFYFTTGAHEDYHTPTDDADKINYTGEVAVLDMVYDLANVLASSNRLSFHEAGAKQGTRYGRNLKVTLGIVPDMVSSDNNGLRVDGVRKGGPADHAGIIKGDRVVSIEGQPVTNIYDYMARLGKLKPGQVASVEIIRDGIKQILIVQF